MEHSARAQRVVSNGVTSGVLLLLPYRALLHVQANGVEIIKLD
jgi:hypothetical protein